MTKTAKYTNAESVLTEWVLVKQALHLKVVLKKFCVVFKSTKEVKTLFDGENESLNVNLYRIIFS
jgi:hypothetical protein